MELGQVSPLALAGMGFSLAVVMLLPVVLCILLVTRFHARAGAFLSGILIFVVFAMVLEPMLHDLVLGSNRALFEQNIWLYAFYGGLAAAVFEETGRWLGMKYLVKSRRPADAVAYGVGHGGVEALLLVGFTYLSNLMVSLAINDGSILQNLNAMDAATAETYLAQISLLWTTPAYQFLLAGVERMLAIALQVGLSVLVWRAVCTGIKAYWLLAFVVHFAVDAALVVAANFLPLLLVELLLAAVVALLWLGMILPVLRRSAC